MSSMRLASLRWKRRTALLLAPALWVCAVDAWVGHLAGKDGPAHWTQLLPVGFGAVAGVALGLGALAAGGRWLLLVARGLGVVSSLLGLCGTGLHLASLLGDLADEPLSWGALEGALAVAPPLFAPGVFLGLGAVLVVLGMERVVVAVEAPGQPQQASTHGAVAAGGAETAGAA